MNFKYYHNIIGKGQLCHGEMHASLHEILFNEHFSKSKKEFILQLKNFLNSGDKQPEILRKHFERGINLSDENRTCLINYPDFPLKSIEPGYFNQNYVEFGLSGGDIGWYKANCFKEEYYFFYETKHPFSQWHKSKFKINDLLFNSAEQYMMYSKAKLFGDNETADKILQSTNVREQKKLGREVKNFNLEIWNRNAINIVYEGNKAKFTQNPEYLELLLSTKGKTIVEASPTDRVWGIGMTRENKNSNNIFEWNGTNWLGIVLTELREELQGNNFKHGYWTKDDYLKNQE